MSSATTLDSTIPPHTVSWQRVLQDAVTNVAELAALLELPASAIDRQTDASAPLAASRREFPLRVPRGFVARMRKGDPRDPLLLQVLPQARELVDVPGFTADPVQEVGLAEHGVVRKYAGRVLLIASGACPIHCRYCFRREFPYQAQLAPRNDWAEAVAALRGTPDVGEVILSGGDPLSLGNRRLGQLFDAVAGLDSVRRVRIHTRFPIVVPERVDAGLLAILEHSPLATVVVVHANHANEIDASVAAALAALRRAGATLLNQSVLLRGVNDDADTLAALCERVFACGVLPYYLHLLDPVAGAAHFDVDEPQACALHVQLTARLPGYLVPRLVREIPGRASKTAIA
jgi:L-lysine 2,3-aminomutase